MSSDPPPAGGGTADASTQPTDPTPISAPTPSPLADLSAASASAPPSADDIRAQVEREQALADLEQLVKAKDAELEKIKAEKQQAQADNDGAVSQVNQLRAQLSTLQSSHVQSSSALDVLQSRVDAAEREKRELVDEIQRLQERTQRSTQELYTLRSQKSEASQKIAHLDVEVSELRMAAESAKFNEERSVKALENARLEVSALTNAHADTDARFALYRTQRQSEYLELQLEHETIQNRFTTTDSSLQSLKRTYDEQVRRLGEAHAHIATLTSSLASQKASYRLEFDRLIEETRVLEKRGDEARATVSDREAELERLVLSHDEREKVLEERCKREERGRRDAEKKADDLKLVVEKLAMAGAGGGSGMFGLGSNDISPAAAIANGIRQSGKSYTEVFTDYTILENKLRASEEEVERLTQLLDEISQDIADKKPILDEQAAEHAAAIERANAIAAELATAITSRDAYETRVKSLEASAKHHGDEMNSLQSTAADLSRQVQSLLRTLAIRDDPGLASQSIDAHGLSSSEKETGDIVTDRLLEFQSIRALQEQNQRLLKLTRGLVAKLDAREVQRATSGGGGDDEDVGAALDKATEMVTRLHTQLLDAQTKINEATRERDFFSKLLAKGEGLRWSAQSNHTTVAGGPLHEDTSAGGLPHQQAITALQAELDTVRVKAEVDVNDAKRVAREKSEAAGVAEVERAKADAKVAFLEAQLQTVNETLNMTKQQQDGLESQLRHIQSQIHQAQSDRRTALEQVASHQATEDKLRNESAFLRAEREQWQSTQARLQSDFAVVQQERAKLQHTIESLNAVVSENERTRAEDRARLERRVEELQRDAVTLRDQVDQAREATRAAERRLTEFDARLASETATLRTEKEAAESLASARSSELTTLNEELTKVRGEMDKARQIGINWQRRARQLDAEKTELVAASNGAKEEKEKEKEKLEKVEKELEEVKGKLEVVEKKAADAERASQLKDGTVARLQSELAAKGQQPQAQAQVPAPAQTAQPTVDPALVAERDALKQRVAQLEKEKADAEAAATAAKATAAAAAATPAAADAAAATSSAPAAGNEAELQAKLDDVSKRLADKEQQYETGVLKVNRANQGLQNRVKTVTAEKAQLEARVAELEKQVAELTTQLATSQASAGAGSNGDGRDGASEAQVETAVKAAVAARETELRAELASASSQVKDEGAIKAAVSARETELNAEFEKRLAEAKSASTANGTASGAGAGAGEAGGEAAAQVVELEGKIKKLERQIRTAEISRKTLERKLEAAERAGGAPASAAAAGTASTPTPTTPAPATPVPAVKAEPGTTSTSGTGPAGLPARPGGPASTAPALSAAAREFKPTVGEASTSTTPAPVTASAAPAAAAPTPAPTPATPATPAVQGTGESVRGTGVRGRARGALRGRTSTGRPNPVLSAVNAALADPSGQTSAGSKRPAEDDSPASDILQRISGTAGPSATPGTASGGVQIQGQAQVAAAVAAGQPQAAGVTAQGSPGQAGGGGAVRGRVVKRARGAGVAGRGGRRPSGGGGGGGAGAPGAQ